MELTLIQQVNLTLLTHWIFNLRKPFYYAMQQALSPPSPALNSLSITTLSDTSVYHS